MQEYLLNSRKYYRQILNQSDLYLKQGQQIYKNHYLYVSPFDMECEFKAFHIFSSWNEAISSDDEWIYMRSRFGYLDSLFLCFEKEKNTKYLDKVKEIIFDFIQKHPILKKEKSTRTLDSGIRIIHIIRAIHYLKECKALEKEGEIEEHLKKTVEYLYSNYDKKYDLSNWGFIIYCGIYTYGYFYDQKIKNEAKLKLKELLSNQLLSDGLHWEKSSLYHMQIVIYLVWICRLEKDKDLLKYLDIASETLKKIHDFNHNTIPFGDSDVIKVDSILSLSDTLLGKKSNYDLTSESYLWGCELCDAYQKEEKEYDNISVLKESGYSFVNYDKFHFSHYISPMSSSHSHVDLLHFNYYYEQPIFVDSGRYNYQEINERYSLKELYHHNSIVIDNYKFIHKSWEYHNYPVVLPGNKQYFNRGYISSDGYYLDGVLVRRKYVLVEKLLIIYDNVKAIGNHQYQANFHLYPNVDLDSIIKIDFPEYEIKNSLYSLQYNRLEDSKKIVINQKFKDEITLKYLIYPKNYKVNKLEVYQKNQIVSDEVAVSYNIFFENKEYIVFIKNNEIYTGQKCFHIKNIAVYGNVVVYKKVDGNYVKIVSF